MYLLYSPQFVKCNPTPLYLRLWTHNKKSLGQLSHSSRANPRLFFILSTLAHRFQCASKHGTDYSFNVNQVDNDFMPFRSMLAPSQTANAIGTDMPALNCTSLASPVSKVRLTTTRHVGPV